VVPQSLPAANKGVQLWFAKIERDVIARGIFTSVSHLKRKLMRYIRYSHEAASNREVEVRRSPPTSQYRFSCYRPLVSPRPDMPP
jgi:hypothetical protein